MQGGSRLITLVWQQRTRNCDRGQPRSRAKSPCSPENVATMAKLVVGVWRRAPWLATLRALSVLIAPLTPRLIVGKPHFLILPHTRVSNLAAHILGQAARSLCSGWHETYSYAPVLWRTSFESIRFSGESSCAANCGGRADHRTRQAWLNPRARARYLPAT